MAYCLAFLLLALSILSKYTAWYQSSYSEGTFISSNIFFNLFMLGLPMPILNTSGSSLGAFYFLDMGSVSLSTTTHTSDVFLDDEFFLYCYLGALNLPFYSSIFGGFWGFDWGDSIRSSLIWGLIFGGLSGRSLRGGISSLLADLTIPLTSGVNLSGFGSSIFVVCFVYSFALDFCCFIDSVDMLFSFFNSDIGCEIVKLFIMGDGCFSSGFGLSCCFYD